MQGASASKSSHNSSLDSSKILVVEDERDLAELLALNINRTGYQTFLAHDGHEALAIAARERPDLVILDVMLPGLSGTEVAARLRSDPGLGDVPILMLTAKAEEVDQLVGLAVGADDYMTKPFSVKVLLARVAALLRRTGPRRAASRTLRLGEISLDTSSHEVRVADDDVKLTLTEFRILAALMAGAGRVLSRQQLVAKAIGPGITVTDRTIDVHITALRKKLGGAGGHVHTVRGVGYRASPDPEPVA